MKKDEKKKDNKKDKKKFLLLLLLILLVSVGYAALTAQLNIDGSTIIKASNWDISIPDDNFDPDDTLKDDQQEIGGDTVVTEEPKRTDDSTPNVVSMTWAVVLKNPGDYYEFTADVKNEGSVNAKLDTVNIVGITNEQKEYATYDVTYEDGSTISVGDTLAAGATKTIKVRVAYRDDIDSSKLPTTDVELGPSADDHANTKELTVRLTFVQDA